MMNFPNNTKGLPASNALKVEMIAGCFPEAIYSVISSYDECIKIQ